MTRDTKIKVAGDVVFAGALTLALVWGEWAVMLALLTAGGVGYVACLADLAADRPVARWARAIGDWRSWRAARSAQTEEAQQAAGAPPEWPGRPDVWPGSTRTGAWS